MSDYLQPQDLIDDKKHSTFFSEVITGKAGGLAGGANIDTATNAVTSQTQKTMPKIMGDAESSFNTQMSGQQAEFDAQIVDQQDAFDGFITGLGPDIAAWTFTTGGVLSDPSQAALYPANGNYYSWTGLHPHTVTPATNPTSTPGYVPRTDVILRDQLPIVIYAANGIADSAGVNSASLSAIAQNKSLAVYGIAHIESATTIDAAIFDTKQQMFTVTSAVTITSGYARPEWFGDDAAAFLAAINAMPSTGGRVELMRKRYDSPYAGPFGAAYMSKSNVTISGEKRPWFKDDHAQLLDGSGSIINGAFYVWADNSRVENLGLDCGPAQRARLGLAKTQDGLVFAPPNHLTGTFKKEGQISDVVSLGVLANDFGHNILHEGYSSGSINNVDGRCAIHNVVCKSSNVKATKIRARGAISDNLIFKSDDYGVCEASSATDVVLSEYPGNTPTYGAIYQAVTAGMSGCGLHQAQILSKAATGLRIESPSTFVNYGFQGSDVTIDGSENGLYIFGGTAETEHIGITNLTIKNAETGIVEQGNTSMNRVTGATFVGCKTQLYTEKDIQLNDVNVIANAIDIPSMVNYGNSNARPTIGSVVYRGLTSWDNIATPVPVNGWISSGGQPLDIFARDGKVNIFGVLDVGTNGLAFTIDARLRPVRNLWLPLMSYPAGSSAYAVLQADGQVIISASGGSTKVSFDGVSYGVTY